MRLLRLSAVLATLFTVSCGSEGDKNEVAGAGAKGGNGGSSASSGNGGSGNAINVGGSANGNGSGAGSGSGGGGGSTEVCDGIDNDNNGITDDVDVGNDGICDCLLIATLGLKGQWGNGNIFATWLSQRSDTGAANLNDAVLTEALLNKYQVIVVQNVSELGRSYSSAEVAALEKWVKAGGGVMTLIGYSDSSEIANANLLLAPYGLSYGAQQILQKQGGSTVPVTNWTSHPVTQGVLKVGVDNGYPVQGGTILATEDGFNMLGAAEPGAGHVLVWGDEWITYDSEWSGHPDYQVEHFWLNAIKWLTPAKQCQVPVPPVR